MLLNYEVVNKAIIDTYKKCNVKSFPIDCEDIALKYGLKLYPYSELNDKLLSYVRMFSDDSMMFEGKILYNDDCVEGRKRFSIMHELGHFLLDKYSNNQNKEIVANNFASNILAPKVVIYQSGCTSIDGIMKLFNVSRNHAENILQSYENWEFALPTMGYSNMEQEIYNHFFNEDDNIFVYKIHECHFCRGEIYNSDDFVCELCKKGKYSIAYMLNQTKSEQDPIKRLILKNRILFEASERERLEQEKSKYIF